MEHRQNHTIYIFSVYCSALSSFSQRTANFFGIPFFSLSLSGETSRSGLCYGHKKWKERNGEVKNENQKRFGRANNTHAQRKRKDFDIIVMSEINEEKDFDWCRCCERKILKYFYMLGSGGSGYEQWFCCWSRKMASYVASRFL